MARVQVQRWLSIALLTLFSSCGESYSEANQGHVCAQGPSKSEAIRRWFVYSYFGVDSVESELLGLGDRFSSKGWLGVETEDVGAYALFVEASRNGDLRVCQPYPDIGLLSGAAVKPEHLLAFVRSKGGSVEESDQWTEETTRFLESSWRTISAADPGTLDPFGFWVMLRCERRPVDVRIQRSAMFDDWRGRPPVL